MKQKEIKTALDMLCDLENFLQIDEFKKAKLVCSKLYDLLIKQKYDLSFIRHTQRSLPAY